MAETSPNILLIMADQLAPHFTGPYGHPVVRTPHLDALAAEGAVFDAAYCQSPLCAPARFAMMSGQSITRIGAYDNASEFPASIPTFAHYLTLMGYRTCLSGKMHFIGPDQLHGFQERVTTDVYPSDFAWTPDWENAGDRIDKWYHNMDSVREAGTAAATFQIDYDDEVAFFARRKIFDYARHKEEPFCLVASFIHPHDPYVARPEWWSLYDDAEIDLPKHSDVPTDPHSQRLHIGIDAARVAVTDEEVRATRRAYYANTSFVDSKIGSLINALDETGMCDNTVVIVTSDHGDMLGERGLWYKMSFLERSVRVPLIFSGPDVVAQRIPNACGHLDILPTLLDIAASGGKHHPPLGSPLDGRSLWPAVIGDDDPGDEAIGEYCAEMTAQPMFMIRRGAFKFITCKGDPPQLFNIVADPEERQNLSSDPDHAKILANFEREAEERWDSDTIRTSVIEDQRRRRVVNAAMETARDQGQRTDWDYGPPRHASDEYVRNHMDWTIAAETTRFPPFRRDAS